MEASNWIAIVGILVSGVVAVVSILISRRQYREQLTREDKIREEEYEKEKERDRRHRIDVPQIQFEIDCVQVGVQDGSYVVELLLILHNKGNVKQDVKSINLRVRGIRADEEITEWERHPPRLAFPHPLFETEVVPPRYNFIFVEPNVRQTLSYTTPISTAYRFIAARAEFSYGRARQGSRGSKHSVERVFELTS